MDESTTARCLLERLAAHGVTHAFGLPGVHNLAFWEASGRDLPQIIGVRHEQTAVYAADGLARATGSLGVALTTTGPGAANAAGAFGEAAASKSPVLLIASEISTRLARPGVLRGVLHESRDQAAIFAPLAKRVFRPRTARQAGADLEEAQRVALACPRGPVYLDIPTDVLAQPAEPVTPRPAAPEPTADIDLTQLLQEIGRADRIVIWAGGGVVQAGAEDGLRQLAERLDAAVITTFSARGAMGRHRLAVDAPPHEPVAARYIAECDLLLALGTDFDGMMTRNWSMPVPRRLASINIEAADLTKNYEPDVAVVADISTALRALLAQLPDRDTDSAEAIRVLNQEFRTDLDADPVSGQAMRFVDTVTGALPPDTVVVADMAIPGYWLGGYASFERSRLLQYPVGWGTLGYALPAAIGPATLGRPVLAVCGDGGVMFAIGELATIAQHRLPVVTLIVDDGGYGMLRFDQLSAGSPNRGVDLYRPDFVQLAGSFGIEAELVTDCGEVLAKSLQTAFDSNEPRVIVVEATMTPPRTTSPRWAE